MNLLRLASLFAKAAILAIVFVSLTSAKAEAQNAPTETKKQVVSANPFGLLLKLFNAEYERVIGESTTAGFGGSGYFGGKDDYINADAFLRFYPSGVPLEGWAFGVKAGLTRYDDDDTFFGVGFDVNRSWVLGKQDNFYVGVGLGLKRMFVSSSPRNVLEYIPTIRIINVGIVF